MSNTPPSFEPPGAPYALGVQEPPPQPAPEPAGSPPRRARHAKAKPTGKRRALEWAGIVAVAVVVALLLRTFVVQTFYVPSGSMTPTLQIGDRILVNKLAYHFHGVGRGDIIVFKAPPAVARACDTNDTDLVKRVIGLPNETISDRNGTVYIDGKPLAQPWLPKNDPNTYTPSFKPVHIGPNSYFVMGDDRAISCDSRYWGTVPRSDIIGKVEMRIWPLDRIGFF